MLLGYVCYDFEWLETKIEGHFHLKNEKQETLRIPLKYFEQEIGDEISKDGKLYDVINKIVNGDTIVLTVVNDAAEEQALTNIESLFSNDLNKGFENIHNHGHKWWLKDLNKNLLIQKLLNATTYNNTNVFYFDNCLLLKKHSSIIAPPPELKC